MEKPTKNIYASIAELYEGKKSCFNCDLVAFCSIHEKFIKALDVAETAGALTGAQAFKEFLPLLGEKCAQRTTDFDEGRDDININNLPSFHQADLCNQPGVSTHYGFSVCDNTLIVWDEDRDVRVLEVLRKMPLDVRSELLLIHEHEATLWMVWDKLVPDAYKEGTEIPTSDGDTFSVGYSYNVTAGPDF